MTSIAAYNGGLVLSGPDGSLRVRVLRFIELCSQILVSTLFIIS